MQQSFCYSHGCLASGMKPVPRDIFTLPLVGELFYILLKYIIQGGVILNLLETRRLKTYNNISL